MKTHKSMLPTILIPLLVLLPIITLSIQGSSTLTINVRTNKPSYQVDKTIEVLGNLTYNGSPVQNNPVAVEVVNPSQDPVVTRTLQTDIYGEYNATFKLPSDSKLGIYTMYVSASYNGETATSNTTFKLAHIIPTTVEIEGQTYTIITESNVTITNATATKNSLHFTSSGPTGQTAYVNITIPTELNKTQIKVFIDDTELIPPPYPSITTNSTHYFIYFEFPLSTHNITIQYAITDIATTNITPAKTIVGQGYTIRINATIQNQGDYKETFNVTLYANTTAIATQTITLTSGNSITITFTWNTIGFAKGNHTMSAYAWPVQNETDTTDNIYVDGWAIVAMVGDITGPDGWPDGKCDMRDIRAVAKLFGINYPDPRYNPNCDINDDLKIDMRDIRLVAKQFGKTDP